MARTQPRSTTSRLTARRPAAGRRPTPTRRPAMPRRGRKQPQPSGLAGIAQQVMGAAGGSRIGQKAGGVGKGKLGLLAGLGAGGLALAKRKNLFGGSKEEPAPAAEFAAPATPVATDTSVPRQSTAA